MRGTDLAFRDRDGGHIPVTAIIDPLPAKLVQLGLTWSSRGRHSTRRVLSDGNTATLAAPVSRRDGRRTAVRTVAKRTLRRGYAGVHRMSRSVDTLVLVHRDAVRAILWRFVITRLAIFAIATVAVVRL